MTNIEVDQIVSLATKRVASTKQLSLQSGTARTETSLEDFGPPSPAPHPRPLRMIAYDDMQNVN